MSSRAMNAMNHSLYAASFHLLEAAKYLSNIEEFRPAGLELLQKANFLSQVIETIPEKIKQEQINSILNEILNFDENKEII